jgi:hypothetical protein
MSRTGFQFSKRKGLEYNTIFDGSGFADVMTDEQAMANSLGILVSNISNFLNDGSKVYANVSQDWSTGTNWFWLNDSLYGVYDYDGHWKSAGGGTFRDSSTINTLIVPGMEVVGTQFARRSNVSTADFTSLTTTSTYFLQDIPITEISFPAMTTTNQATFGWFGGFLTKIEMVNCVQLGSEETMNNVFLRIQAGCDVYLNSALQGSPDPDLQYLYDQGANVIFV